jgi:hypothetical protein
MTIEINLKEVIRTTPSPKAGLTFNLKVKLAKIKK